MKVTINGIEYKIQFRHYNPPKPNEGNRANTVCSLSGDVISCSGTAWVHPKDTYCKETVRKLSLQRALAIGGFSREERKLFWVAYRYRAVNRDLGVRLPSESADARRLGV